MNSTQVIHRPDSLLRSGEQQHIMGTQTVETPQYAIVYLISGSATYFYKNKQFQIQAGSVIQRFPNQQHSIQFHEPGHSVYAAIPAAVLQFIKAFQVDSIHQHVFDIGLDQILINRFRTLSKELRRKPPQYHMHIAGEIVQLFVDIHLRAKASQGDLQQEQFIIKACELLQKDLDLHLDIPRCADELGMSYANFRKRFKQGMGMSPGHFRIQQKIEESKHRLLNGVSINDIVEELGYPDCYSFSKQFKKYTGIPPRQFRQQQGLL